MKMRKTWFSYLLWLAFVVVTAAFSAIYLPAAEAELLGQNQYTAVTLIVIAAVLAVIFWLAGHKIAAVSEEKLLKNMRFRQALEGILVTGLLAAAVFYRFQMLKHLDVPGNSVYYDMAYIKNSGGVPRLAHGASYCYAAVLSAVFSFSGNKIAAGLVLQAALQVLSLLLLYLGIRPLAGRTEAFWIMAILAFLPSYAGEIYELRPEILYFFLWAVAIFLIGQCGKAEGRKVSRAVFFLTGIYIGIMGFLDVSGWLLLLFAGGLCIKKTMRGESDGKGEGEKEKYRDGGINFIFCLLGAGTGMFGCLALDAALSGSSLESIWNTWLGLFSFGKNAWILSGPESDPAAGAVLCFGSMLLAVGFWFYEEQKQDVWILLLLAAMALNMGAESSFSYHILLAFAWAVPAGIGIASMGVCREAEKVMKAAVPDIVLEDMDQEDVEEEAEETPGVKLIENPLPLPKKHIRRGMDFDRLVEAEKMRFDIPVDESDDFDI